MSQDLSSLQTQVDNEYLMILQGLPMCYFDEVSPRLMDFWELEKLSIDRSGLRLPLMSSVKSC